MPLWAHIFTVLIINTQGHRESDRCREEGDFRSVCVGRWRSRWMVRSNFHPGPPHPGNDSVLVTSFGARWWSPWMKRRGHSERWIHPKNMNHLVRDIQKNIQAAGYYSVIQVLFLNKFASTSKTGARKPFFYLMVDWRALWVTDVILVKAADYNAAL